MGSSLTDDFGRVDVARDDSGLSDAPADGDAAFGTASEDDSLSGMPAEALEWCANALGVPLSRISNPRRLSRGHTNSNYLFELTPSQAINRQRGDILQTYIYRQPGDGTEEIISRAREVYVQRCADALGLDGTTVAMDARKGRKLSRFIPGAVDFSYDDAGHVSCALSLLRRLHDAKVACPYSADMRDGDHELRAFAERHGVEDSYGLKAMEEDIACIYEGVEGDGVQKRMCHNDACDANFLVTPGEMRLIDWEYGGLSDPGSDLASFICGASHSEERTEALIEQYFGRKPSFEERRHMIGYIALYSYHWLLWAECRSFQGMTGNQMPAIWQGYASAWVPRARELYA